MSRTVNPRLAILRQSPVAVAPSRGAMPAQQPANALRRLPASVGQGDRLYAALGGITRDVTGAIQGDLVSVPPGARLTCVSCSGSRRWSEENQGIQPSGNLGGRDWSEVPRLKVRLQNYCEGYALSAVGWQSINDVPYPEPTPTDVVDPWFTASSRGSLCGTYNVGFPEEINPRVLIVRYGPHTVASFPVRPDATTGVATIDLNTLQLASMRLIGLPPGSLVFDAAGTDITTRYPSGSGGGWENVTVTSGGLPRATRAWVIGVPTSTRMVKIRYPNGRDLTVTVPQSMTNGAYDIMVPPQPAIQRLRVRLVFPQVTPARVFAVNSTGARGEDVTIFAQPDGTNATWDGTTWVFGAPLDTQELDVRDERTGAIMRLALPVGSRVAGDTVTVNFPQPTLGVGEDGSPPVIRTNPVQRFEARIRFPSPQSARFYAAVGDILGADLTTTPPPSGVAAQWVGSAWVIGVPVGTRRLAVVYPDGVRQFVDLPAVAQGQSVTVDLPARSTATSEGRFNLRIENASAGDQVFTSEANVTTSLLANGAASTYDAAARVRTIGLPNGTAQVRVRTTDGEVRTFTVPPPVSGVSTIRIPAPDVAPTRKDVLALGFPAGARLFVDGIDVTNAPLTSGQPAGWVSSAQTDWKFSVPSAARSVTIEYPSRASRTLLIGNMMVPGLSGGYYEVTVPVDTTVLGGGSGNGNLLSVARRITVILRNIPASSPAARVMYGGQDISSTPLPDGSPARREADMMVFGFDYNPAIAQSLDVEAGGGSSGGLISTRGVLTVPILAQDIVPDSTDVLNYAWGAAWPFNQARPTALGGGSGNGNLLSVARRIRVRLNGIPASFAPPAAPPQVMYGGRNIASTPLPDGTAASVDVGRSGRGIPGDVSMNFGFDFDPAIAQEFAVIAGSDERQFNVRAANIVPDPDDALHYVLPLNWSGAPVQTTDTGRTGGLANARIWMIDPPAGTYAVAKNAEGQERRLDGPTTQLAAAAVLSPSDMPNGVAPLAGNASSVVWVTEALFPDGTASGGVQVPWVTATASIVLPDGTRLPVSLSPVPMDGILRVQLSSYPGARPTQSSSGGGVATANAGGGIGFGTVAIVGGAVAALWYYRKSLGRLYGNG